MNTNLYKGFNQADDNVWTNLVLNPNVNHNILVSESRYLPVAPYMLSELERRSQSQYGKPHKMIYVTSSLSEKLNGNEQNVIIVDDQIGPLIKQGQNPIRPWISYEQVDEEFNHEGGYLNELVKRILANQSSLDVDVIYNVFSFHENPSFNGRIKLRAPDRGLLRKYDDKFEQYEFFEDLGIPQARSQIVNGNARLMEVFREFPNGLFITKHFGGGGCGSRIYNSSNVDLDDPFFENEDEKYLVREKIDFDYDSTITSIIFDRRVYTIPIIADHTFDESKGSQRTGIETTRYPSVITPNARRQIFDLTERVSHAMMDEGYRGPANFDFLVRNGEVLLAEINPRWFASLLEWTQTFEIMADSRTPSLPVLFMYALENDNVDINVDETKAADVCWERKYIKELPFGPLAINGTPRPLDDVFRNGGVTRTELPNGRVLSMPGNRFVVNITAVSNNMDDLIGLLREGERELYGAIRKN